jgi:hypothetical protein
MSETQRELPQAAIAHPLQERAVRQPARSARERPAGTAGRGAEREGNGYREWQAPAGHQREAVVTQLVNKSSSAELRATTMLIDMLRDIEKRAEPAMAEKNPFSPTDKEVVQQLIARLRRDMCNGCPRAAQRGGLEASPAPSPVAQDAMAAD